MKRTNALKLVPILVLAAALPALAAVPYVNGQTEPASGLPVTAAWGHAVNLDIRYLYTQLGVVPTLPTASNSTAGVTKLSVAASTPTNPIAVGDNDPRVPTSGQAAALVGTSGTPGSGNKYVTDSDSRMGRIPSTSQYSALAGSSGTPGSGNKYVTEADARLPTSNQTTKMVTSNVAAQVIQSGTAAGSTVAPVSVTFATPYTSAPVVTATRSGASYQGMGGVTISNVTTTGFQYTGIGVKPTITAPFGGTAANISDGNATSYATTGTSTGGLFAIAQFDFRQPYAFASVTTQNLSFSAISPSLIVNLQSSTDGSSWTTQGGNIANTDGSNVPTLTTPVTGAWRYWRIAFTSYGSNGVAQIGEVTFAGPSLPLGTAYDGQSFNWIAVGT